MKKKFLFLLTASALLVGSGLTSCEDTNIETIEVNNYGVSIKTLGNGTVSSSVNLAKVGETVSLTITPDDHYGLKTLVVNGSDKFSEVINNSIELTMVEGGLNIEATFVEATYKVEASETENGTIEILNGLNEVIFNTHVNVKITPNFGYVIEEVKVNNEDQTSAVKDNILPLVVGSDVKIEATFKALEGQEAYLYVKNIIKELEKKDLEANKIEIEEKTYSDETTVSESVTGTYERFVGEKEGEYTISKLTTASEYENKVETKKTQKTKSNYLIYTTSTDTDFNETTETLVGAKLENNENRYWHYNNNVATLSLKGDDATFNEEYNDSKLLNEDSKYSYEISFNESGFTTARSYVYSYYEISNLIVSTTTYNVKETGIEYSFVKNTYNSDQFSVLENGKGTLNEGAKFSSSVSSKYVLTYGTLKEETNKKIEDISKFAIEEIAIGEAKDTITNEEVSTYGLEFEDVILQHKIEFKLDIILPTSARLDLDEVNISFSDSKGCVVSKVGSKENTKIAFVPTSEEGSFAIVTATKKFTFTFYATTVSLNSIKINQMETNKVKINNILQFNVSYNDICLLGANVGFEFENGKDKGSKITFSYTSPKGYDVYQFFAGSEKGDVKFRAVSTLDSSIKSDWFVVTVEANEETPKSLLDGKSVYSDWSDEVLFMFEFGTDNSGTFLFGDDQEGNFTCSLIGITLTINLETPIHFMDMDINFNEAMVYSNVIILDATSGSGTMATYLEETCDGDIQNNFDMYIN